MEKNATLIMILAMALSLCACGGKPIKEAPEAALEEKGDVVLKMVLYAGATIRQIFRSA